MSAQRPLVRWQPVRPMPGGLLDVTWTVDAAHWPLSAATAMVLELSEERTDRGQPGTLPREAWHASVAARVEDDGDGGWSLRACFELPADGLPTTAALEAVQARWWLTLVDASRSKRWRQSLSVAMPPGWAPPVPPPPAASHPPVPALPPLAREPAVREAPALALPASVLRPIGPSQEPDAVLRYPVGWRRALGLLGLLPMGWGLWQADLAFAAEEANALLWTLVWLALAATAWAWLLQSLSSDWVVAMQSGWVMRLRDGALWRSRRAVPAFELRGLTLAPSYSLDHGDGLSAYFSVRAEPRRGRSWRLTPGIASAPVAEAVAARLLRAWRRSAEQTLAEQAPWPEVLQRSERRRRVRRSLRYGAWRLLWAAGVLAAAVTLVPEGWRQPEQVLEAWGEHAERLGAPAHQRVALRVALRRADTQELAELLAQGASPDIRLDHGETALMRAARRGRLDQVELLLHHGAQLELASTWADNQGDTALLVALLNGYDEVALRLGQAGARWSARNEQGWTAMHMAAQSDCTACLQLAQAAGVPLNRPDSRGETPATLAAAKGKLKALAWLRERQAQPITSP